jgi:DNA-binding PadR family transcriptional regulator
VARKPNSSPQTQKLFIVMLRRPRTWQYGYELSKDTDLSSGTLYPLLMRLSDQGLLEAEWQEPERPGKPPRHAYRLTSEGLTLARTKARMGKPSITRHTPVGATT